jgi:hypothetical protein
MSTGTPGMYRIHFYVKVLKTAKKGFFGQVAF